MNLRSSFTSYLPDRNARILEIGPLNRPLVDKQLYPNTVYCDIRSTSQIKALYTSNDYLSTTNIVVPIDEIVDIDFVLEGSYSETFKDFPRFDYVVASHVLEHVEDLIGVLNDIMSVLSPEGKLIVFYPDKRYCFDHFRAEASFRDAYDVHIHNRPALARMVLDFFHSALPENNPFIFWQAENIEDLLPNNSTERAIKYYEQSFSGEFMDDVHYWPFSDAGLIRFLYDCVRADLLRVSCTEFYPTEQNTQECLIILKNSTDTWNRDEALQQLRLHYKKVSSNYYNSKQLAFEKLQANIDELQRLNQILQNECSAKTATVRQHEEEKSQLLENLVQMQQLNKMLQDEYATQTTTVQKILAEKEQLEVKIQDAQENFRHLSGENGYLKKANQYLVNEQSRLIELIDIASRRSQQLQNEKDQLAEDIRMLQNQFEDDKRALQNQSAAMQDAYECDIKKIVSSYESSTSWKVTTPLRTLKDLIKKLRKA